LDKNDMLSKSDELSQKVHDTFGMSKTNMLNEWSFMTDEQLRD